jgi:biofilm PGA synthesis N-glycosyltransferase PgaC
VLSRETFLFLTLFLTLTTCLVSFSFEPAYYRTHVWPYILIFLGFSFVRYFFFTLGALIDNRHREKLLKRFDALDDYEYPSVSILVPAYNEEKVIAQTISHLAQLNYPNYEVVIIDDGSVDNTAALALNSLILYPHIPMKVVSKQNGGKAEALNFGLANSSGELILGVDADGRLDPNALVAGAKHFMDPRVASVAGYVEVEGHKNLLEQFQQLEYMISLNFLRKAYSTLGIVPVVPGPVGMFRREALNQVEGLTHDRHIFAEDAELSMRLISYDWKIRSEEDMIAYTEAPGDWQSFFRQRYRWNRGVFQALSVNFNSMVNSKKPLAQFAAIHLYVEAWILPLINILLISNFLIRLFFYREANLFTVWIVFAVFWIFGCWSWPRCEVESF